jgi:predicted acylesterase/phospholipase RssA
MVLEDGRQDRAIWVSLSGGGHRATLFSLGVLMYMTDAALNTDVMRIDSVSGGSITNGYIAQECNYNEASPTSFRDVARPLAKLIAYRGTLFASWLTWAYLIALLLLVALISLVIVFLSGVGRLAAGVTLALGLGIAIGYRGAIASYAFGRVLFSHGFTRTKLRDIHDGPIHVFCTTDLLAGEPFYFSRDFIHSYHLGWGSPHSLKLQTAVQASAALPGAFPPTRLRTARFNFVRNRPNGGSQSVKDVFLVDGGVYNNLGTEWIDGFERRGQWQDPSGTSEKSPTHLVVVNSSGQRAVRRSAGLLRWPYLRDVQTIPFVTDVLYANTIRPRLRAFIEASIRASRDEHFVGLRPAVIQIDQSPLELARGLSLAEGPTGERASNVVTALEGLVGQDDYYWIRFAERSAQVATTLNALGEEAAAHIIHHGYVSAMTVLYVLFAWPLLDPIPGNEIAFNMLRS